MRRRLSYGVRASILDGGICAWCSWPSQLGPEDSREYQSAVAVLWRARVRFTCAPETDLVVDHAHPIHQGGTNAPENLRALCGRCNTVKGCRTDEEVGGAEGVIARRRVIAAALIKRAVWWRQFLARKSA